MTELAEVNPRRSLDVTRASYKDFDEDLINLVKSSIMPKEATNAETYFLLQLAATYGLDPFAREIWAAKMKGKSGEKGGVAILIGRDGLLSIAERHKSFRGFRNQAVYSNDEFAYDSEPRKMPDGTYSHVRHSFNVTVARGELLGAWAEVYREGRPPVFFWAPLEDYLPKSEAKLAYSPWSSMRNVMIEKCALATALRVAFRITGLYIEEEMTNALMPAFTDAVVVEPAWPEDGELKRRLQLLFRAAEETKPGSWLPGKVQATLEACSDTDEYLGLAVRLEEFITEHGGALPDLDAVVFERADAEEEEVEEADYVVLPDSEADEAADIPFGEDLPDQTKLV